MQYIIYVLHNLFTNFRLCTVRMKVHRWFNSHSHSMQVFLYDGTQYCNAASFLPFFIIGIAVIVFFVIPAPFVMYVLIVKRWQVSSTEFVQKVCPFDTPVYQCYHI